MAEKAKKRGRRPTEVSKSILKVPADQRLTQPISASLMKTGDSGNEYTILQQKAVVATIAKLQDVILELREQNLRLPNRGSKLKFRDVALVDGLPVGEDYPVKIFLNEFGVGRNNYMNLRQALKSLRTIPVDIPVKTEEGRKFVKYTTLCDVYIEEEAYSKYVILTFRRDVLDALINTDFGVQLVQKNFLLYYCNSTYTQKLYLLINQWADVGEVTISMKEFRERMGIVDKYQRFSNLVSHILEPAKKELKFFAQEGKVDCYFDWRRISKNHRSTGEPDQLLFVVYKAKQPLTEIEQRQINDVRTSFVNALHNFKLDDATIKKYESKINAENYLKVFSWFTKVNDRIFGAERSGLPPVRNIVSYIKSSLANYFDDDQGDLFATAEEVE